MKGIRFRPERRGIRASLFDLEADIMEIVWSHGWEQFTVAQVRAGLEKCREIAHTTVMTTVSRLFDKEVLTRVRDGKRYVYRPVMDRPHFVREMAREVFESLEDIGRDAALAVLVERVAEADADELSSLEALIHAKRRELHE